MEKTAVQSRFHSVIFSLVPETNEVHFLLAVSGGVDSMVMLHLFMNSNLQFSIAHCNFSLRGKESDADEQLVQSFANKHSLKLYKKIFDTKSFAKKEKISTQLAARNLRYQWFEQIMKEQQIQKLATAHHLDDDIETFFINLNRGTALQGLTGIPRKKGDIIRPLLNFSKEELYQYADEQQIPFREDKSNEENKYLRNWIRNSLLSLWTERNPQFSQVMQNNMQILSRQNALYQQWAKRELNSIKKQVKEGKVLIKDIKGLADPAILLFEILQPLGFSFSDIEQLVKLLQTPNSGKQIQSGSTVILVDRDFIFLKKNNTDVVEEYLIANPDDTVQLPIKMGITNHIKDNLFQIQQDATIFQGDKDKITFPLILRKWKKGDLFTPLGMKGKKKVSDYLIDEKVPLTEKENVYVVLSDEKIIWLVEYRMDDTVKITDNTVNILKIKAE